MIKQIMDKFETAKKKITETISHSLTEEDPGHSENAWRWLLKLKPDADEVLQLAALGHDIERAMPDRLMKDQFKTYDEYKSAHAKRAGELLKHILIESGYVEADAKRVEELVGAAEFSSDDPDVQLISDADSISYFDYNIDFYLKRSGEKKTHEKMQFMYERASERAKHEIEKLVEKNMSIPRL
jgi:hypothetical protein